MKDAADHKTGDLLGKPPRRGRPPKHGTPAEKKTANAAAARAYRARKKAEQAARRDPAQPLHSKVIDLSALPAWHVTKSNHGG